MLGVFWIKMKMDKQLGSLNFNKGFCNCSFTDTTTNGNTVSNIITKQLKTIKRPLPIAIGIQINSI